MFHTASEDNDVSFHLHYRRS